jgi:hypothetical protein
MLLLVLLRYALSCRIQPLKLMRRDISKSQGVDGGPGLG